MENNIPNFTFCITSKNNLRYLKHAIRYIKENCFNPNHEILIFIDSDNDGTEKWCIENNISYIKNPSLELYGIGRAYNTLVQESLTDFVVIYHADMIAGKNFDINLYKHWSPRSVISATRIEPPLHPSDPAKIVENFGLWPEIDVEDGFKTKDFNSFIEKKLNQYKNKTTNGIFAPWLIHKSDFNEIGGHDLIMKSHSEDRDLFNRFLLNGYNIIQSWDSLVYHLTCRGGQFEHAKSTQDLFTKSEDWNRLAYTQTREFIRKWGGPPKYNEYQYPIVSPKYNIGIILKNSELALVKHLEPWCSKIYMDDPHKLIVPKYIKDFQKETFYDLSERVINLFNNKIENHNVMIYIDGNKFNNEDFTNIQIISEIIKSTNDIGTFELGNLEIIINSLESFEKDLIYV